MSENSAREVGLTWLALGISFSVFLVLGGLLAWLGGRPRLVLPLAGGLALLLGASLLIAPLAAGLARVLRWDIYRKPYAYIALNLLASGSLTVGWLVHAVSLLDQATTPAVWWQAGLLYLVGLLATVVALHVIQETFTGDLYRLANTVLGFGGYLVWGAAVAFF